MKIFPNEILWFCRIFGGIPLEYTPGQKGIKSLTFSTIGFWWGLALLILQEIFCSIVLYMQFRGNFIAGRMFWLVLAIVSLQITVAVIFLSYAWKYPRLIDICDTLDWVDRALQHKTQETKIGVKLLFYAIAATLPIVFTAAHRLVHFDARKITEIIISAVCTIPILLIYTSKAALLVHFIRVTQSVAKRFRIVNARIKEEITSNILERIVIAHRPKDCITLTHQTRNELSTTKKLKSLMNIYWLLCDAVHQANVFYCDQLLATVFSSFLCVTISSYLFFLDIRSGGILATAARASWALTHIFYVILLFNSSSDVTDAADKTSRIICKLINKELDSVFIKQLEGFLQQLPHHNVKFSARGFFRIHNETLTSIAGAVTTYLVIMIQFQAEPLST